MHCTEGEETLPQRRALLGTLMALSAAATATGLAGCVTTAPAPSPAAVAPPPAPPRPAPAAAPPLAAPTPAPMVALAPPPPPQRAPEPAAAAPDFGPRVTLPAPPVPRSMDELKRNVARRMVAASPRHSTMAKATGMLFAIVVLEIEFNADGSVRNVSVVRPPANPEAAMTVPMAVEAIRRGAPYGDVSRLPRPWKFTEVFLFNDKRLFKPRTLD